MDTLMNTFMIFLFSVVVVLLFFGLLILLWVVVDILINFYSDIKHDKKIRKLKKGKSNDR